MAFSLQHLVIFAKAAPLCCSVEMGLAADAPLSLQYHLDTADNGLLQFFLEPTITNSAAERTSCEGAGCII